MADAWADSFRYHMAKDLDLTSNTFYMALYYSELSDGPSGWSTGISYISYISGYQVSGSGYTISGNALDTVTWTQSGATVDFDCSDVVWTTCTFSARYAVVFCTSVGPWVVGKWDLGSLKTPDNGTLTITPNATGLFTLS